MKRWSHRKPSSDDENRWLEARNDVQAFSARSGQECFYRPQQLLVADADVDDQMRSQLKEWEATPDKRSALGRVGVTRYFLPPDVDVPAAVTSLRSRRDGRVPRVGPNHVFLGEPNYHGGPGQPLGLGKPIDHVRPPKPRRKVSVGVLDTGVRTHHEWLSRYDVHAVGPEADEEQIDRLDADQNQALDRQSGHGTFIAGVVLQQAPRASVKVASVLDSDGVGDEESIISGLQVIGDADIVNLSLGGYTYEDAVPVGIAQAVSDLIAQRDSVVVAAAGNNAQPRPFWPAALKNVVAVAALTEDGRDRAGFSNFGWWVDACAPGENVRSTFVKWVGLVTSLGHDESFEGWATWGGTSFAAPKVAGAIAAYMMEHDVDARAAAFACVGSTGLDRRPELGVAVRLPAP